MLYIFSLCPINPTEYNVRLNAVEILGQEMNTMLEKTEDELEALKTANQGKKNFTDPLLRNQSTY